MYRIYDSSKKKFINNAVIDSDGIGYEVRNKRLYPNYNLEFDGFTDLEDIYATLIYEKDIIRYWKDDDEPQVNEVLRFCGVYGILKTNDLREIISLQKLFNNHYFIEVIGNTHEDPNYFAKNKEKK